MLFYDITILDENLEVKEHQYVLTEGAKITYIGNTCPETDEERYNGKNKLLMTGFFNLHSHTPMTFMRGYGENLSLDDWLNKKIFPYEDKLTSEDIYVGTLLGIAEMLRFGIVSTSDMYYFCEDMLKAFLEVGVKCNLSRGITCFSDASYHDLPAYEENKILVRDYHNKNNGQIKIDFSIHGEYTNTERTIREISEHAKSEGLPIHIHVSETEKEHQECMARHNGMTPIEYFNHLGVLDSPVLAAHCVHLSSNDFAIMKEKGVSVASCPASNLKLASGICDVKTLFDYGINVGIGTDSVASNNSLNMLEEIKLFALLQKVRANDPAIITPKEAIYAATKAGAIAQGRLDTGTLKVGNRADLIVLDMDAPYWKPVHNLTNNLVYSAAGTDVCLTMVDGKVLYQDGNYPTLDIEKLTAVQKLSQKEI